MRPRKTKPAKPASHLDKASLFFTLVAATLVIIGFFLNVTDTSAVGVSDPGKYGQGGGKTIVLPGTGVILIGLFFAIFPLKDLILDLKQRYVTGKQQLSEMHNDVRDDDDSQPADERNYKEIASEKARWNAADKNPSR